MTIKAETLLDSLYNFTPTQQTTLERLGDEIKALRGKKIGLDTLNSLTSIYRELDGIRENVMLRLVSSLKRGDKVD
jgi:hypothetical protein